jgi:hypothetical protein
MTVDELANMFDGAKVQSAARLSTTEDVHEMITKVEQDVLAWGEEARGAIRGEWAIFGDGHLFSLEIRNGAVRYDDGQSGKENVKHLECMKPQTVEYIRLDNTKPNDNVLKAVKNRRM